MARHMRNGLDYSRPGPKVDYELREGSNNAARSGEVYNKIKEIQSQIGQNPIDPNPIVPTGQSRLLLDTSEVTTSEKIFTLEDDYTNYKELYFEVEMNFSRTDDINLITSIIRMDALRKDIMYLVYRQAGASSGYEGGLNVCFVSENNTDVKIVKFNNAYNGCRRLRIFGIN